MSLVNDGVYALYRMAEGSPFPYLLVTDKGVRYKVDGIGQLDGTPYLDESNPNDWIVDFVIVEVEAPTPEVEPVRKVTEFVGRASGDCECFCFDRRTDEQIQQDEILRESGSREGIGTLIEHEFVARIYPQDLLPKGVKREGRRGRYRITVEFWPEGS